MLFWLGLGWAGVLVLPWYADGGWLESAVIAGHPWLWPLVVPLLLATVAAAKGRLTTPPPLVGGGWGEGAPHVEAPIPQATSDRPLPLTPSLKGRGNMIAGAAGLFWLTAQAFLIGPHGPGLSQLPLGWGALAYTIATGALLATGLARVGWGRGEPFITGALTLVGGTILIFVLYPVISVLGSAIRDNNGLFAPLLFLAKLTDPAIWTWGGVAWNTLLIAIVVGAATTLLGLAFALLALRTALPLKPLLRALSILPIITPPFVIGLALILLFGRAGMITTWLAQHAGIPRSRWIYGFWGITIAQVLAFTPIAFLVLMGVLQGVSPTLEEAARTLRASPWRSFRTVTWPLLRPGLANAFLIGFVESMADFANPLVIGGNFSVLSTEIFFAVVGAAHDQGRAAVLALVLLIFTLAAFGAQHVWLSGARYTTVSGKGDSGLPSPLPSTLVGLCLAAAGPWLLLTVAVYGTILIGGFVEQIGRDNTPTLQYFLTAFSVDHGVGGWFLSGSAWPSFLTTMKLALIATPVTAGLGILTAWLLDRISFRGRKAFEFATMMSFAIPGTVIGIGYILAFNVGPLQLTGTGTIIVAAFVFRNMPVGIRAGLASLSQIDRSLDEASLLLRAGPAGTLLRVILPLLRPAIATAMIYSFVRAVTAVSAVIFLVTGGTNLATVYIVGRADVGEYGVAIVYAAVLIVFMALVLAGIQFVVGDARLGRRRAAPALVVLQP